MLRFGVAGALMGLLVGELISVIGIVILSFRNVALLSTTQLRTQ
jgi:hypothetical protein